MSDRPLLITQRQVRAICSGARKAGYAPVIEIGNIVIRLLPKELALPPPPKELVDEEEEIDL